MGVLGTFKQSKQGGWEGTIRTLTIERKVRLIPNDNRRTDRAPDFLLMMGWTRIGEAWESKSRADPPREYLRVEFDDPVFDAPRTAALFADQDGLTAELVWNRPS